MKEIILANKSKNVVSFDVQKEYVQYHDLVDIHELSGQELFKESKKLFLTKTPVEEKKKLLFLLAHIGNYKAFNVLQKYEKKSNPELKTWTELCLQECAAGMSAELLNQEETFMVMAGAGGDGKRLRCYFVFSSAKLKVLTSAQNSLIKKLVREVDKKLKTKTESLKFGKVNFLVSVLLPMDIAPEEYFQEVYKIVNSKKEILRYHYYCDNVQKPTLESIQEYLKDFK